MSLAAKYTAEDWDRVRKSFATSIMVDTQLSSLAQNLDGPDWPIKGKEETPAAYIDLSHEELVEFLALKGQPPERVDLLIGILNDTLSFDDPFGEMVQQSEAAAERDNPLLRNMARLEIPENFPLDLTTLGAETREFCKLEKLTTLGEFAMFAQDLSQRVIVGGDFRKLLNALSHVDEQALSECLPFRRGSKGLHLPEALAQAGTPERALPVISWFKPALAALKQEVAAGGSLTRYLVALGDPAKEAKVAELLRPYLVATKVSAPEKPAGFFSVFSRLFKK